MKALRRNELISNWHLADVLTAAWLKFLQDAITFSSSRLMYGGRRWVFSVPSATLGSCFLTPCKLTCSSSAWTCFLKGFKKKVFPLAFLSFFFGISTAAATLVLSSWLHTLFPPLPVNSLENVGTFCLGYPFFSDLRPADFSIPVSKWWPFFFF